ncbi:MAG: hypothetical protein ACLPT4_17455, partial [Verrucomicrobiia bacterium]
MKKNPDVVNVYRVLLLTGILCQASVANAQFGDVGGLQLQAATNQPPAAVSEPAVTNQPPAAVSDPAQSTSPTPDASGNKPPENAEAPGETQKAPDTSSAKTAEASIHTQAVELKKAMYGLPLGASLDEMQKWFEEKNVQVRGDTKSKIDEATRQELALLNNYGLLQDTGLGEEELKGEKQINYAQLEQQLPTIASNTDKARVSAASSIEALQKLCMTLKNPTFSYKGTTYFLSSVIPGLNQAFGLVLLPSDEMKNDGIQGIIVFCENKGNSLVSYGAAVALGDNVDKVVDALNGKYGEAQTVEEKWPGKSDELYRITGDSTFQSGPYEIYQWRKNVLMTKEGRGAVAVVIYYDAEAAKRIIHDQDEALREIEA